MLRFVFLLLVLLPACPSNPTTRKLTVTSQCDDTIWIQQQNHTNAPEITKLTKGQSAYFPIPDAGLASTRYWAKKDCDDQGNNCKTGQSSPPCPADGCAPPVDSKLEATWGCILEKDKCTITPQGHHIQDTFWNSSAVDGFTLPYSISVNQESDTCKPVDCSALSMDQCPVADNLSVGFNGQVFPQNDAVDLVVAGAGGCYSPCMALGYPGFGGKGIQPPSDDQTAPYCCPTPPVSSPECQSGPVVSTDYVTVVHAMCKDTAYAYAYDDGLGGRTCDPKAELVLTFCPPAE
jgi:hypothetical protein